MREQMVTSHGQSHRSSKCQSKRLPPLGKATARANARAKGYLPWAKPPLEQMPEQKVTSLGQSHRTSKCQSKRLPPLGKTNPPRNPPSTSPPPSEKTTHQKTPTKNRT